MSTILICAVTVFVALFVFGMVALAGYILTDCESIN